MGDVLRRIRHCRHGHPQRLYQYLRYLTGIDRERWGIVSVNELPIRRHELRVVVWGPGDSTPGQAVYEVSQALGEAGLNVDVVHESSSDTSARIVQDDNRR